MYNLAVTRDFVARHFLIGGDWGDENSLHSHHYKVEVRLEGRELDRHGYLVDIVDIEKNLDKLVRVFRDHTLNELSDFEGLNPSIEHFTKIFCKKFVAKINTDNLTAVTLRMWENEIAWASYRMEI
jgi:6-pyruvoyltetrahydropterin/6-carboxytetrahydropterin synthase